MRAVDHWTCTQHVPNLVSSRARSHGRVSVMATPVARGTSHAPRFLERPECRVHVRERRHVSRLRSEGPASCTLRCEPQAIMECDACHRLGRGTLICMSLIATPTADMHHYGDGQLADPARLSQPCGRIMRATSAYPAALLRRVMSTSPSEQGGISATRSL
jgi:hypothetical protein